LNLAQKMRRRDRKDLSLTPGWIAVPVPWIDVPGVDICWITAAPITVPSVRIPPVPKERVARGRIGAVHALHYAKAIFSLLLKFVFETSLHCG